MRETLNIVLAEDDEGHATLVRRNLKRAGISKEPVHLRDGQEVLDYMYRRDPWSDRRPHRSIAMILDLNMPRLGGIEVLRQLKADREFARIPVFVLTTTDNPAEIERCYTFGASACLVKPVDYGAFAEMMQRFAEFLIAARMPGEPPYPPLSYGQ
jgi:CheY-like chemotaxis protein